MQFVTRKRENVNFSSPQEMYDDHKNRSINGIQDYQSKMLDFDNGFYLDNREAARSYHPAFLQERYSDDLFRLYKEVSRKFVRLQSHELFWIKERYTHCYEAVVYRMIENLAGLIMRKVEESSVSVTDDFKIIYGEFMDKAVVLYAKEKKENEILSD